MESAIDLVSQIFGMSLKYCWEMYIGEMAFSLESITFFVFKEA